MITSPVPSRQVRTSVTIDGSGTKSAENGHSRCFLCGDRNPRSLRLCFQAGDSGIVTAKFQANEGLQGYDGTLHGGMIAALLDSAMTHWLFYRGRQAVTGG